MAVSPRPLVANAAGEIVDLPGLRAAARESDAPLLPLYAYTAACWYRGRICVPARRVDDDAKHDPESFSREQVRRRVKALRKRFPENRLIRHHGERCALEWGCPNAQNLFLGRYEAPI